VSEKKIVTADAEGASSDIGFSTSAQTEVSRARTGRYKPRSHFRGQECIRVASKAARGETIVFDPIVFDVDCIVLTNAGACDRIAPRRSPPEKRAAHAVTQVDRR
jgi:hypothetical protein